MQVHFENMLAVQDAFHKSPRALAWADQLASATTRLSVIDIEPPLNFLWSELFDENREKTPAQHRLEALQNIVKGFQFNKLLPQVAVLSGRPIVQIVQEVMARCHDLVVKQVRKSPGDMVLGSLDMRLVRNCPVSLLLAQERATVCHRVLVAINPEASPAEKNLNDELIRHASSIARQQNCKIFVVAAWSEPSFPFDFSDDYVRRLGKLSKNVAQNARSQLMQTVDLSVKAIQPENIIFQQGEPASVITAAVESVEPDLLVIGTVAKSNFSRLLLGSTTDLVLRKVDCSTLLLKPKGFVSPILPRKRSSEQAIS